MGSSRQQCNPTIRSEKPLCMFVSSNAFLPTCFFEGKMVHVGNLGVILGQMRWNFWVCPGLRRHADLKGQVHIFVWIHQFFSSIHLFCHCHSSRVVILTATSTKIVNKLKVRLAQIQTINASHIFMYICPACNGQVESNIATGQVNHRKVCGNQFSVKDGVVLEKRFIYKCPFCTKNVTSNVRTGQINHGSGCNNRFYVKDGEISRQRRCHAHYCPVCATVVWSSQSCGRIRIEHDTPAGKRCHKKQWHVPDKEKKNKKRKK